VVSLSNHEPDRSSFDGLRTSEVLDRQTHHANDPKMRILIVAATAPEIDPVVAKFRYASDRGPRVKTYTHAGHEIDVLVTGVGMVATSAWCSRVLAQARYNVGLNLGICGSFDPALAPGAVVQVITDRIAELGAEDGETFLTIAELKLPCEHEFVNAAPLANAALSGLPAVAGITVNTVHGNARSIAAVTQRFKAQVESMEGAAFMYACLIHDLPFAQVRAVSNMVETRNREVWKIAEAIHNLGQTAIAILDHV
jgi:futalosine hydrolase